MKRSFSKSHEGGLCCVVTSAARDVLESAIPAQRPHFTRDETNRAQPKGKALSCCGESRAGQSPVALRQKLKSSPQRRQFLCRSCPPVVGFTGWRWNRGVPRFG